jgi:hypothetical protein
MTTDRISLVNRIDHILSRIVAIMMLVSGVMFGGGVIIAALQGAHVIPNIFLRPGTDYDAYTAVVLLLTGEFLLFGGVVFFKWAFSRKMK